MTSRPLQSRQDKPVTPALAWVLLVIAIALTCAVGIAASAAYDGPHGNVASAKEVPG